MARTYSISLTKLSGTTKQPDTGRTVTIKDLSLNTLGTASESPANSGQYVVTIAETPKWANWYVDGVIKNYNNNNPFWVGIYDSVSAGSITALSIISRGSVSAISFSGDGTAISNVPQLNGSNVFTNYNVFKPTIPTIYFPIILEYDRLTKTKVGIEFNESEDDNYIDICYLNSQLEFNYNDVAVFRVDPIAGGVAVTGNILTSTLSAASISSSCYSIAPIGGGTSVSGVTRNIQIYNQLTSSSAILEFVGGILASYTEV